MSELSSELREQMVRVEHGDGRFAYARDLSGEMVVDAA